MTEEAVFKITKKKRVNRKKRSASHENSPEKNTTAKISKNKKINNKKLEAS